MLHFWRTKTRPWQAEVIARCVVSRFLVFPAFRLERLDVKQMHAAHVRFETLRTLTCVANRPAGFVDFTQDVFRHGLIHALDLLHLEVLGQLFCKAELFCKLVHDHVVAAAFPQWLNDFFTPLN